MVDQDEIDKQVFLWLMAQSRSARGDTDELFERWEQFVLSHDDETAEALRRSAYFEAFRLLDAFTEGILHESQTGTLLDESIIEQMRRGGAASFKGDREKTRFYLKAARMAFKELSDS